jgi:ankyrin repeat protein
MLGLIRKVFRQSKKQDNFQILAELTNKDFFSNNDIVQIHNLLKDSGVDVDFENPNTGYTLLLLAIKSKHENLVKCLLEKGANPDGYSQELQTYPLLWSVRYQDLECSKLLLDYNADVTLYDKTGCAAIHVCVKNQTVSDDQENLKILRLLSKKDVNIREKKQQKTALMLAANYGLFDVIDLLLDAGAACELKDEAGTTAYKFLKDSVWVKSEHRRRDYLEKLKIRHFNNS